MENNEDLRSEEIIKQDEDFINRLKTNLDSIKKNPVSSPDYPKKEFFSIKKLMDGKPDLDFVEGNENKLIEIDLLSEQLFIAKKVKEEAEEKIERLSKKLNDVLKEKNYIWDSQLDCPSIFYSFEEVYDQYSKILPEEREGVFIVKNSSKYLKINPEDFQSYLKEEAERKLQKNKLFEQDKTFRRSFKKADLPKISPPKRGFLDS